MKTLAPRILPGNREVRGHVEKDLDKKALDFFCKQLKTESSEDAKHDTEEEFGIDVCVKRGPCDQFNEQPITTYDVYIGKKEHS